MGNTFYFAWEVALMVFLQTILGTAGATVASAISTLGEEMVMIAVLGFFYWSYDKKGGRYIGLNIVTGAVFFPMIKNVAVRRRPYMDHEAIKCLKPVDAEADIMDINAQGYSFPSGHSTNSMLAYGSVARYKKNKIVTTIVAIVVFLVGVSRFCVGVHYPTDVLCGWALGLIIMFVVPWLDSKFKKDWIIYIILLVVALPGFFFCTSNDFYTGYGMMLGGFAGFVFEEKFVKFENTKNVLWMIIRVVVGGALFFGLNTALKLPFSSAFLDSGTTAALLVRMFRYTVVIFLLIGIYPMLFKFMGSKKAEK